MLSKPISMGEANGSSNLGNFWTTIIAVKGSFFPVALPFERCEGCIILNTNTYAVLGTLYHKEFKVFKL